MWESIFVFVSLFLSVSACLCLALCLHLLIAVFVLSLWILKHAGNLQKKLLPCMRTKQSAAGGGRRLDCGQNLWDHLCGRRAGITSTGCCRQRAAGRRQQGNMTNLQIGRIFQSAWAVFGTTWKGLGMLGEALGPCLQPLVLFWKAFRPDIC